MEIASLYRKAISRAKTSLSTYRCVFPITQVRYLVTVSVESGTRAQRPPAVRSILVLRDRYLEVCQLSLVIPHQPACCAGAV